MSDDGPARAALSALSEPGDGEVAALVHELGAGGVLEAVRDGSLPSRRTPHLRTRLPAAEAAADLGAWAGRGIRFLCPGDEEWPPGLDDLPVPPLGLWIRGSPLGSLADRSVALVGSRACTAYGDAVAAELAAVVAERGWTVVSGAAYGIDAAAHRGALAVGGPTVAVLACGVDVAYPRGHDRLLQRIVDTGAVVSELPPGSHPTKTRFLERNRVIAALSRATVVVEAAVRSGALNTAAHAVELSRHVMAVPGPVTSAASAGCHRLVRDRMAELVASGEQVLDLVGDLGVDAEVEQRGETRPYDQLDPQTMQVLEALPAGRPLPLEAVVLRAGIAVNGVLAALTRLEAAGLAERRPTGWRVPRGSG